MLGAVSIAGMTIGDVWTLHAAALALWQAGDAAGAERLDRLARKISAGLDYKSRQLAGTAPKRRPHWSSAPSVLAAVRGEEDPPQQLKLFTKTKPAPVDGKKMMTDIQELIGKADRLIAGFRAIARGDNAP